jgi:hypothetical protein
MCVHFVDLAWSAGTRTTLRTHSVHFVYLAERRGAK